MNKKPSKFNKGLLGKTLAVGTLAGSIVGAGYLARPVETSVSSESMDDTTALWSAMQDNFMVTDARIGGLQGEGKDLKRSQSKLDKKIENVEKKLEDKIIQSEEILRVDLSRDFNKNLVVLQELVEELGKRFGDKWSELDKAIKNLKADIDFNRESDIIIEAKIDALKKDILFNYDANTAVMDRLAKLEKQIKDMELASDELLQRVGNLENKG